ncbi:recombinase family protein [Bradyrhizobium sp. UFLA05-153]
MTNALVVHKDKLPAAQKALLAAQYVRMSTDYQKYSIENQAAAIAAYAQAHGLTIACTYRDEGESGLRIKGRLGLARLIEDVQTGRADFSHVLVYDVSRWGRFQDVDESAYYEFICKQAGIRVAYCAEQFDNDGSLVSSIVKNIKRVMAAEFSRELSVKVHAGSSRLARLGYKMGGTLGYGLERLAVDEKSHQKGILRPGERKYLGSDHVRVGPGSTDERAEIRRIFDQFARGKSQADIIRDLNRRGVPTKNGQPWNSNKMCALLRNETYIGNLVWNRVTSKLGTKKIDNPEHCWIRSEGCVDPIVDQDVFLRAKKILEESRVYISEEEMLTRLRKVLAKKGSLSIKIIDSAPGLPSSSTYAKHFGTLQNVYRMIGYKGSKYCNNLEAGQQWINLNVGHAARLLDLLEKRGQQAVHYPSIRCLRINDAVNVCFGVAKWRKYVGRRARWPLVRRARPTDGWIVAMRLAEGNASVLDYLLVPAASFTCRLLWISEKNLKRHKVVVYQTFDELARSLVRRVSKVALRTSKQQQRDHLGLGKRQRSRA